MRVFDEIVEHQIAFAEGIVADAHGGETRIRDVLPVVPMRDATSSILRRSAIIGAVSKPNQRLARKDEP